MSKEQELNKWLATEIMGWEYLGRHSEQGEEPKAWYKTDNRKRTHWNPLENLEQAFECLEEYCKDFDLCTVHSLYNCVIWQGDYNHEDSGGEEYKQVGEYQDITKPKAIIGAICKAEGIYEDYKEVFNNDQT